ncbi:MAG: MEDS domain-containing protein [Acidimicrobiales bacterium]
MGLQLDNGIHLAHFYESESGLLSTVADHLIPEMRAGAAIVIIGTPAHRLGIAGELAGAGIDVDCAVTDGRLVMLDAAITLEQIMWDGHVDAERFDRIVGETMRRAAQNGSPVSAFGEMVSLLWDAGDIGNVLDLESLWNDLGRQMVFSLLCSYKRDSDERPVVARARAQVRDVHSSVRSEYGDTMVTISTRVTATFDPTINAPAHARHLVVDALRQWGCAESLVADASLVASELASNVVVHVGQPFSISMEQKPSSVRIAVEDSNVVVPVATKGGLLARSGRGLRMVSALAGSWGVELNDRGKIVWAEFPTVD